jgi:AraC-like DNA-binding protein
MTTVSSPSGVRREWLFGIARTFQLWAGMLSHESASTLRHNLTALPPPHTRLEALVLKGLTAELWEHLAAERARGVRAPSPLVFDAQRYLEAHYQEHVTLAALSRALGYSREQLTREFRSVLGTSVHRYLTELRTRRAVQTLRDSSLKVESVALMVGYKSKKDLYRSVRAMTGATPKQVRSGTS